MSRDDTAHEAPTRRDCMKYGGVVVGAGLLAGCTGGSKSESTPTESNNSTEAETDETTGTEDSSYSMTMAPAGEIEFDQPPKRVTHYFPDYADMSVALGHGDSIVSRGIPSRFHTAQFVELDGVCVDSDSLR